MPRPRSPGIHARIHAIVRRIPRGRVATYGQVASLAGLGGHARQVGYARHALAPASGVPWQRVVNARGEVSPRRTPGGDLIQRVLLEREGVRFDARARIDLARFGWPPGARAGARAGARTRSRARTGSRPRGATRRGRA